MNRRLFALNSMSLSLAGLAVGAVQGSQGKTEEKPYFFISKWDAVHINRKNNASRKKDRIIAKFFMHGTSTITVKDVHPVQIKIGIPDGNGGTVYKIYDPDKMRAELISSSEKQTFMSKDNYKSLYDYVYIVIYNRQSRNEQKLTDEQEMQPKGSSIIDLSTSLVVVDNEIIAMQTPVPITDYDPCDNTMTPQPSDPDKP